jgi:hypothetical protein
MISFTTSQPVHWPPAASPVVAPVASVSAVQPTQATSRDTQTGANTGGRDGQAQATRLASGGKDTTESTALPTAPLLPREQAEGGRENAPSSQAETAEKAERLAAEAQAQEKAEQKRPLQDVLTSVWKASAAVVDVVLGREQQLQAAAAAGSATGVGPSGVIAPVATDTTQAEVTGTAVPTAVPNNAAPTPPGEGRSGQEPVAYTEQGTSSWAPLEAGSLISRRV